MNIVNVSLMSDLTEDIFEIIPIDIKLKFKDLDQFGDLVYSYDNINDFDIGEFVLVQIRNKEVIGRIESFTNKNDIRKDIEYKRILRKVTI